jgi:2-epi-5-epi-valiolone 7-kinase
MLSREINGSIAVFDLGGTWFRWGRYNPAGGLADSWRVPAISYLSHPHLGARELQQALTHFILQRTELMRHVGAPDLRVASVSIGAPVNAHDQTVLGSGPLWGPSAKPLRLHTSLCEALPDLQWHVVNDITALLAPYMDECTPEGNLAFRKTLLITVSTGIGSRLYDHQTGRIPYDATHGVQGEIGHLTLSFELDGRVVNRCCECGAPNHLNAFSSGRGIAQILKGLPRLSPEIHCAVSTEPPIDWEQATDDYRLHAFVAQLDRHNPRATALLDAFVTPLSRTLAGALALDPEIDRIVITGGVAHGLGGHYRDALQRTFLRDGLYQISERDPQYLARRLHWEEPDDFAGLRGAGVYAANIAGAQGYRSNQ